MTKERQNKGPASSDLRITSSNNYFQAGGSAGIDAVRYA
jgi:hypothetical protein